MAQKSSVNMNVDQLEKTQLIGQTERSHNVTKRMMHHASEFVVW